ncbi:hypothetical protein KUBF_27940 [Bacteroides finegoldii]|nr:hypothetical protein KUBF_27940 [Bacteroides finegoldii]
MNDNYMDHPYNYLRIILRKQSKMKNFILLSFLVLQSVLVFAQEQPRVSQLFNFDWKFRAGDLKEAQLVTYDDDDWRVLDLPHDFQIEQTWDESAGGARGFKAMGQVGIVNILRQILHGRVNVSCLTLKALCLLEMFG